MDTIRKFTPLSIYFALSKLKAENAPVDRVALLGTFLYTFTFAHIFIGIVFSFLNPELYYSYTEEDSYIEYFTAFILLATAVLCFYKAFSTSSKLPKLFLYSAAIVFFLGFGEEISWGQRIIGFETPDDLEQINAQKEFNFHNIHVDGVNLNKLIFGKVLYTCVFIYFLAFPILYRYKAWFKNLVDKVRLPIPTAIQSLIYFVSFFSILLIREGEKWELQEFALASFVFFAFLLPFNKYQESRSKQRYLEFNANNQVLEEHRV
ncbi:hypothetical protein ABID22_001455 [Pontibacter aydingkolensis]|uniref:Uncharacterized protein n=1 Tax=Pontibacter aydingkolensis TaxID=1911536 RepID=A0ABS7CPK0_9BACT|nr:hypothetical protein [Pontibacter aydingkolensis]MBW7465616.1 hypothetical protein [Pontibacter aydingkolensis]